jgi:hypothetical protein
LHKSKAAKTNIVNNVIPKVERLLQYKNAIVIALKAKKISRRSFVGFAM